MRLNIGCVSHKVREIQLEEPIATLYIKAEHEKYHFYAMKENQKEYMGYADTKYLSSEVAGGFTGVMIGLYAVDQLNREARFTNLHIEHIE